MDINRLLKTLDDMYAKGALKEAEALLTDGLDEALNHNNAAAELTIYNELEGLFRTTGRAPQAAEISDKALKLIEQMGLCGTVHHATTLLNGATANRWAGNDDKALKMYMQAAEIYKKLDLKNSYLMASLYNNISHIYQQKKQYEKALESLQTALDMVSTFEDSTSEIATTKVAMALCYMAMGKMADAKTVLQAALSYYESDDGKDDGHYGSALSAVGEYYWREKDYDSALGYLEKALKVTHQRFGENAGCKIIRKNIERINEEKNK